MAQVEGVGCAPGIGNWGFIIFLILILLIFGIGLCGGWGI